MDTILSYTKQKVEVLFDMHPDAVHGIDHAMRVAEHAEYIAREEGEDEGMSVLAGLLHDIGRAIEKYPEKFSQYDATKTHHELSYDMLRDWFREDNFFDVLTDTQKLELLYAVRYHWNDEANEYVSAYILRDADKIDGLGEIGFTRAKTHHGHDPKQFHMDIRLRYEWIYHFKTDTAKRMFAEGDLMAPFEAERTGILTEGIKTVEL